VSQIERNAVRIVDTKQEPLKPRTNGSCRILENQLPMKFLRSSLYTVKVEWSHSSKFDQQRPLSQAHITQVNGPLAQQLYT
jgi:hypothetical protein